MNDPFGSEKTPSSPPGESSGDLRRLIWGAGILVAGIVALVVIGLGTDGHDLPSVPYSDFAAQVEAGNMAAVTLKGQRATGELKRPVQIAGDRVLQPDASSDPAAPAPVRKVTTTIAEDGQDALTGLLRRYDVTVSIEEAGGAWWSGLGWLLAAVLPTLAIAGVLLYLGRGAQAGHQPLNLARSHARLTGAERPRVTFADVAGEDEAKEQLAQVVDFLRHPAKYHALGARLPRGALLVGPPGTGKTLLAKAVAGEADVPFFSASASAFVELFVGLGASRIRDLFTQAKAAAPAIVYLDEIDAIGRQRFASPGGGNEEREQTLNQLLAELDGFGPRQDVVVLATTNRPDVLDPALLRPGRFDRHVMVGLPDRKGREAILRLHASGVRLAPEVDLGALAGATPGFAGADLANLVNEAALLAARHDKARVGQADLEEALDRIVLGAERPLVLNEHERRVVAYHEAGHALAARLTPGADPVRKVSIIARGRALGVTMQAPDEDRVLYTRAELRGRLAVLLGGRTAEELVFGEVTSGAENDLQVATALARKMVGRWGMSEDVGLHFLGLGEEQSGQCGTSGEGASAGLLERAEAAVGRLLEAAHEDARRLLTRRRDALDRLSEALLREETLDAAAVAELLSAPAIAVDLPVPAAPVPNGIPQSPPRVIEPVA